jgi:hypothetical protein
MLCRLERKPEKDETKCFGFGFLVIYSTTNNTRNLNVYTTAEYRKFLKLFGRNCRFLLIENSDC